MPNSLEDLVQQLQQQAGSRGSTFAGRLMPKGSNQSIGDVMSKPPIGELETAGNIDLDAIKSLGSLIAAAPPAILKKMKLPDNFNFKEILEKMYQNEGGALNRGGGFEYSKDQYIQDKLALLALSSNKSTQKVAQQYYPWAANQPSINMLASKTSASHGLPRTQQVATIAEMADKAGLLDNPEALKKIHQSIQNSRTPQAVEMYGEHPVSDINPELLNWYKKYLEMIKPDK